MADFESCIADAVGEGGVSPEMAEAVRQVYADARALHDQTLSPQEADRRAADATLDALKRADIEEKRQRQQTIRSRRTILEYLAAWKTKRGYTEVKAMGGGSDGRPPKDGWTQGGRPPAKGPYKQGKAAADFLIELVDGQGGLAGASGISVKGRYQAIRGKFDAMMAQAYEKFESHFGFDKPGRATLGNIVREAFGEDTGDAVAKQIVQAWRETAETARLMFNEAGGSIGQIKDWGLPQSHNLYAVMRAGKEAWVDYVLPLLDRSKMTDNLTGAPFTQARLRAELGGVWENISTAGAASREPGERLGTGMLAKRRQDERFLVFRDADAWLGYQAKFGRDDPYAAMMGHLDGMARDIAQMHVLGPNPTHQFDWLARFAEREAAMDEANHKIAGAYGAGQHAVDTARKMFGLFRGELAIPYGRRNIVATVGGALRAYLSGAQLGSAVINDVVSNPVFAAQARAFTGLSKTGDFKAYMGWVLSPEVRKTARRSGFILEGSRRQLAASAQDLARSVTVGDKILNGANWFARRVPPMVYRLSLLSPNLTAQRWAFQHEFMGLLHDMSGKDLATLATSKDGAEQEFGRLLKARGFSPADWDKIRATPPEEPAPGATFISPMQVGRVHGDEMGFRVAELIERQTRLAVPEPSLWAQAQMGGGSRPGTVQGEFWRSVGAYRSFTITQSYLYSRELMARAAANAPGGKGGWIAPVAAQAASLAAQLTIAGALGLQLREVIRGNDPRPMTDARFWQAAMMYGGGLGIVGDFLYSAQARNGKGSSLTSMGAPAAFMSDVWNSTIGLGMATSDHHDKHPGETYGEALAAQHPGRQAAHMAAAYSPLSSIWWTRAAWDRLVTSNLQRALDPDADEAFQHQQQGLKNAYGQTQWWPSGQAIPERAPDMSNATASAPGPH